MMFRKIYGQQIEVQVTGKITFQIPTGMPDKDGNEDRSDAYVINKIRNAIQPAAGWDELDIKVGKRTFGELVSDPATRETVTRARQQFLDDTIGTKGRLPKNAAQSTSTTTNGGVLECQ